MTDPKEPCFFSHREDEQRTREWYESLFNSVTTQSAVGEGSTAYTHPDVIEATAAGIKDLIPSCRLIYMVRHPLKRLESDWRMRRHEGWTPESIATATVEQPTLVSHGFYWKNLSVYRRHFPDDQILIVFLEDFSRDPSRELRRCFSHIGVDPRTTVQDASRARNTSASFRKDSFIAGLMRQSSRFEGIKAAMPSWVTETAKRLLTKQENFEVVWEPSRRQEVLAQLADDAKHFLAHCQKPDSFWDLSA